MKTMQRGDQVVVTRTLDATIYTIKAISACRNPVAELVYQVSGREVNGGLFPLSGLLLPTKKQLHSHK